MRFAGGTHAKIGQPFVLRRALSVAAGLTAKVTGKPHHLHGKFSLRTKVRNESGHHAIHAWNGFCEIAGPRQRHGEVVADRQCIGTFTRRG